MRTVLTVWNARIAPVFDVRRKGGVCMRRTRHETEGFTKRRFISFMVGFLLLFGSVAFCFGGQLNDVREADGWGKTSDYQQLYNVASVQTIKGHVNSQINVTPIDGMREGCGLTVVTAYESIPVQLAPCWYIKKINANFEKGEPVEITGSRVLINDSTVMMAAKVKTGAAVIMLRDEQGMPVWDK